jgi:SAM-dependent methyltransferase
VSGVGDAYRRMRRRVPPHVRRRVPATVRRAIGSRLVDPGELRELDPRARTLPVVPLPSHELTNAVYERLGPDDVRAVEERLPPPQLGLLRDADPAERKRLTISFGLDLGLPAFAEKVGWGDATPPDDVHAMARGPVAVAGALYFADLVADGLRAAGMDPGAASPALDFGCSSGRVVRAIAAAAPWLELHGCDPNADAIAWARANLPQIAFEQSPQHPPLPYPTAKFDYVFAISIFSHLGSAAATAWLDEMHRVIRPGGALILTAHGHQSLAHYAEQGARPLPQLSRIGEALQSHGHWFDADFGPGGDWGVDDPQWGTAFMSLEWLMSVAQYRWHLALFAPGRAEGNQDVIVLRREPGLPAIEPQARTLAPRRLRSHEVTDALFEKLDPADVEAVHERMSDPDHRRLYDTGDEGAKRSITLSLGLHHGVGDVAEKTGLSAIEPPEDVHAMARGALSAGGGYWYGDLVVRALRAAGADPAQARRALDFGASSGRVLRPLALVYPQVEWHGCDPNGPAIEWARQNLAPIRFEVSPQRPPLPYPDDHFDFVYAISIWSHFDRRPAIEWLEEMRRIVRPGGHLILTTHGHGSLAYYRRTGERSLEQLVDIDRALYREGFWYAPEFGDAGDWGVKDDGWGTAYLSAEWLLENALPQWQVVDFGAAEVAENQDLFVLRRVS